MQLKFCYDELKIKGVILVISCLKALPEKNVTTLTVDNRLND